MSEAIQRRRTTARARRVVTERSVSAADRAWIMLLPVAGMAILVILLLAPPVGRLLFPDPGYHYWVDTGVRKSEVHAGYVLFVVAVIAYAGAIVKLDGVRLDPRLQRVVVVAAQASGIAFVVACWVGQRGLTEYGRKVYFTTSTLVVATVMVAVVGLAVRGWHRGRRSHELLDALRGEHSRMVGYICLGTAALATIIWLLPAIHTDHAPAAGITYLNAFFFDESTAILNGRHPLVDMVAYGSVWPYLVAIPLAIFGGAYSAFTVTMVSITGLALLAVFGILRRVTRHNVLALGLYLPVLASSFFLEYGLRDERYDPGTYFGMFPLRYAGPYFLAWLTARHIQRTGASRWSLRALFAAAGLVAVNNIDFGGSALAATAIAVAVAQRTWDRRAVMGLFVDLASGLLMALALVSAVTLASAGSLPHFELLLRYGRVFVNGGYANLPLPGLGLHLVVSATFVAAAAVAAVRVARSEHDDLLGPMLAWCAMFGLGASIYYYGYRSHPDVLINLFSIWSLTLALLVVAALRAAPGPGGWPSAPSLAVLFGCALAACSIAQVPNPWEQVQRIVRDEPIVAQPYFAPNGAFREPAVARIVAERTRPGERVVILSPVGHRIARDVGVVNVSPYTGLEQMPAREQLEETMNILQREGGSKVFVAEAEPPGLAEEIMRLGYDGVRAWDVDAYFDTTVTEYSRG